MLAVVFLSIDFWYYFVNRDLVAGLIAADFVGCFASLGLWVLMRLFRVKVFTFVFWFWL